MRTIESPILRDIGLISRCIQSISDVEFKRISLQKGQFIYLTRICENPGISQAELTGILKVDKTSTAKAVQKLENVGFIERIRDEKDQRILKLYPTQKGLDAYPSVIGMENRFIDRCLSGFTEEERNTVHRLIERMSQNMEQEWTAVKYHRPKSPPDHPLVIEPYQARHQAEVIPHILRIQRDEFLIPVTIDDQPDLLSIESIYQAGLGNFFVALDGGTVVGTIGLIDIGNRQGALRKMFVKPGYRGKPFNAGQLLWQRLLEWSRSQGLAEVYLGTHPYFHAAHRFYEKNGFQEVGRDELPAEFQAMKVDTKFYQYII